MKKITIHNIKDFIFGNLYYYYKKILPIPKYIEEQLEYRKSKCKDDCIPQGKCIICQCPPLKKHTVVKSCNPDRFPDLMKEEDWEKFKENEKLRFT